ncbi:MAG: SLC13 family permease, partial [Gammaproteobacteria bacterium]|nr:SLC13 family permease [Gammaproteobacteria bacterium]
ISGTVGIISSFMQNVGAAALFLPVVARISAKTKIPMSRLLMPMGFCAILGGTMTMVGSSPLILLNDLILASNQGLLDKGVAPMETFSLFEVTPVGIALVATGIIYFVLAGRFVLPIAEGKMEDASGSTMEYFKRVYGIEGDLYEVRVPGGSPLVGMNMEQIEALAGNLFILASRNGDSIHLAPPRDETIRAATILALLGKKQALEKFVNEYNLSLLPQLNNFGAVLSPGIAGISEVVVPPSSVHLGKTLREMRMRKTYGTSVLAIFRDESVLTENLRDIPLKAGDTLVLHSTWEDLAALEKNRQFVVTTDFPREEMRPHKAGFALLFFAIALSLIIFSDLKLSIALFVGAMGMIISGVLTIDEAYESVSWKTVFLLASLIPLGMAVETSGTAAWIAHQVLSLLDGVPVWGLQLALAVLATFFTLVMSNVGAVVLLVPLAVNIALGVGADPRIFALTVALAVSNSFLIPTHQVNALIMGPAGYRVKDFMRAGGIMTGLFLVVLIIMLNVVF